MGNQWREARWGEMWSVLETLRTRQAALLWNFCSLFRRYWGQRGHREIWEFSTNLWKSATKLLTFHNIKKKKRFSHTHAFKKSFGLKIYQHYTLLKTHQQAKSHKYSYSHGTRWKDWRFLSTITWHPKGRKGDGQILLKETDFSYTQHSFFAVLAPVRQSSVEKESFWWSLWPFHSDFSDRDTSGTERVNMSFYSTMWLNWKRKCLLQQRCGNYQAVL